MYEELSLSPSHSYQGAVSHGRVEAANSSFSRRWWRRRQPVVDQHVARAGAAQQDGRVGQLARRVQPHRGHLTASLAALNAMLLHHVVHHIVDSLAQLGKGAPSF